MATQSCADAGARGAENVPPSSEFRDDFDLQPGQEWFFEGTAETSPGASIGIAGLPGAVSPPGVLAVRIPEAREETKLARVRRRLPLFPSTSFHVSFSATLPAGHFARLLELRFSDQCHPTSVAVALSDHRIALDGVTIVSGSASPGQRVGRLTDLPLGDTAGWHRLELEVDLRAGGFVLRVDGGESRGTLSSPDQAFWTSSTGSVPELSLGGEAATEGPGVATPAEFEIDDVVLRSTPVR